MAFLAGLNKNDIRACPACGGSDSTEAGEENGWVLARCNFCGLRYTVDLPTEQQLETLYQGLYSDEGAYAMHLDEVQQVKETGKNKPGRYRSKIFLQRYRPQPGDRLLDVGCGVGTFMMAAEAQGWRVEGIELSDSAVRASNKIHNIPVQIGDFLQIDLEPGAFRAIVAWEVLEHLPNPRAFVAKARRLLSPGVCSPARFLTRGPRSRLRRYGARRRSRRFT